MSTTQFIIGAVTVVIVIALVICSYRRQIVLSFKGWGIQAKLDAKGGSDAPNQTLGGRNVSIGGDAKDNQITTGDSTAGKISALATGRSVSIGGKAERNTIVTGDGNKIG